MDINSCLNHFISVAENKSFLKTALKLNVTVSTVSKQIKYLESWCGEMLLHRTTRQVKLTLQGERFLKAAKQYLTDTEELKSFFSKDTTAHPKGTLRMCVPATFNEHFLLPITLSFIKKYPHVRLVVSSKPFLDELISEKADIVFAHKQDHSVDVRSKKMFIIKRNIFAAPKYLKKYGEPHSPKDLLNHNCLIYTARFNPYTWIFTNGEKVRVTGTLHADNYLLVRDAAIEGIGVFHMASHYMEAEIKTNKLVTILKDYAIQSAEIYAYYLRYRVSPLLELYLKHVSAMLDGMDTT